MITDIALIFLVLFKKTTKKTATTKPPRSKCVII
jgi:hypothetical protein